MFPELFSMRFALKRQRHVPEIPSVDRLDRREVPILRYVGRQFGIIFISCRRTMGGWRPSIRRCFTDDVCCSEAPFIVFPI